ncbi:hypothetical protein, partial [Morganella morganii]|uniref:hypothetical protein n=1 Tax=Morganella morganii TaxID=582 RepID=UPI00339C6630
MKVETIVDDFIMLDSKSMMLPVTSRCVEFKIEDISISFKLKDVGKYKDGASYNIIKGEKSIDVECYIFEDKGTRFGITKSVSKLATVNNVSIFTTFLFERKTDQKIYSLIINFFKKRSTDDFDNIDSVGLP